jgi:hypothetical protein
MNRILRSLLDGAIGGVVGTIAMTAAVAAARALGGAAPPLSRRVLGKTLALTHLDRYGLGHDPLSVRVGGTRGVAEHLGVGLGLGALFGGLTYATRHTRVPLPVQGALYGGLVFAAHRFGALPSPSFLDPDDAHEPLIASASLAAHVAFGAVIGVAVSRLAPLDEEELEAEAPVDAPAQADAPDAAPEGAAATEG